MVATDVTLHDLCGKGKIYSPRVSADTARWIHNQPHLADAVTGNQITIVGETPILCSAGTATQKTIRLFKDIGHRLPDRIYTYSDEADRIGQMRRFANEGKKIIHIHAQSKDILPAEAYWINPDLVSFLCNKANLLKVVPAHYAPSRAVCERERLLETANTKIGLPLILKVATELSSGSGNGIYRCETREELFEANNRLTDCDTVVLEELLDIKKNYCLNFTIDECGKVNFLGATEQIIDKLIYVGNWLDSSITPPATAIEAGIEIMEKAFDLGYKGFSAIDVAEVADGSFRIYDLNFRCAGSTTPLILYHRFAEAMSGRCAMFRSYRYVHSFDELLSLAYQEVQRGDILPFNIFDPLPAGYYNKEPRLFALLFGTSRDAIKEKEGRLAAKGLI